MRAASPALPRRLVAVSEALSLLGVAGLILTLALGFETPNTTLLVVSGLLTFAAPLAALWHLAATPTLTSDEKRVWGRALIGADAFPALSEYMKSPDLRASAQRLSADAVARRASKN